MTIFVRWSWQSNEQLLLILYFYDDYSQPNIRGKVKSTIECQQAETRLGIKPMYSWAPSHVEQGLIAELLSFANRINGSRKRFEFNERINTFRFESFDKNELIFSDVAEKLSRDVADNNANLIVTADMMLGIEEGSPFIARRLTKELVDGFLKEFDGK
jgi:hypothetical protein